MDIIEKCSRKKLYIRVIIFIIVVYYILASICIFLPMFYNDIDYAFWKCNISLANTNLKNSIVIFSDSTIINNSFQKDIMEDSVSLAINGSTPIEAYYLIKEYLESNKPEKIILSFHPYHFEQAESFWSKAVSYDFITEEDFNEIISNSIKLNDFPYNYTSSQLIHEYPSQLEDKKMFIYNSYIKYYLHKIKSPYMYINQFFDSFISTKFYDNSILLYKIKKSNFNIIKANNETDVDIFRESFNKSLLIAKYFDMLLRELNKENIKVCFKTMPLNQSSITKMSNEYIEEYYNFIKSFKNRFPNFEFNYKIDIHL